MKLPTGENLFAAVMIIAGMTVVWGIVIFVLLKALPDLLGS
jgi:hypothetical protein